MWAIDARQGVDRMLQDWGWQGVGQREEVLESTGDGSEAGAGDDGDTVVECLGGEGAGTGFGEFHPGGQPSG